MAKTSKPISTSITTRKTATGNAATFKPVKKTQAVTTNGNGAKLKVSGEKSKTLALRTSPMAEEAKTVEPVKRNGTAPKHKKKIVAGAARPANYGGDNFPSREDPAVFDPTLDSETLIKLMRKQLPAAAPIKLSEETRRATLLAFQMAYESHQREQAMAAQAIAAQQIEDDQTKAKTKLVTQKPKKHVFGRMSEKNKRLTILAFQAAYEEHQGKG